MTTQHDTPSLFAGLELRLTPAADPTFAASPKGRRLARLTRMAFEEATLELDEIFERAPSLKTLLRKNPSCPRTTPVTLKTFAALWFGIDRSSLGFDGDLCISVAVILKTVESCLLRHVIPDTERRTDAAFRLSFSGHASIDTGRTIAAGEQELAVFRACDLFDEMRLAGVEPFFMSTGELSGKRLPNDVEDLFSVCSAGGDMPDGPLSLMRDYLLFLEGDRWETLNTLYRNGDKKGYTDAAVMMLKNFYKAAGQCYSLNTFDDNACSSCRTCTGWLGCTKANGSRSALNQKEKALLQLTKPIAWVAKKRKNAGRGC